MNAPENAPVKSSRYSGRLKLRRSVADPGSCLQDERLRRARRLWEAEFRISTKSEKAIAK